MIPLFALSFLLASSLTLLPTVYAPLPLPSGTANLPPRPPVHWDKNVHTVQYHPAQGFQQTPAPQTRRFTPEEQKAMAHLDELMVQEQSRDSTIQKTLNYRRRSIQFGSGTSHDLHGYNKDIVEIFELLAGVGKRIIWASDDERQLITSINEKKAKYQEQYKEQMDFQTRLAIHYTAFRAGEEMQQSIGAVFLLFYQNKLRKLALRRVKNQYEMQHLGNVVNRAAYTWIYTHLDFTLYFDEILKMIYRVNDRTPIETYRIEALQKHCKGHLLGKNPDSLNLNVAKLLRQLHTTNRDSEPSEVNARSLENLGKTIENLLNNEMGKLTPNTNIEAEIAKHRNRKGCYIAEWANKRRDDTDAMKRRAHEILALSHQTLGEFYVEETRDLIRKHYALEVKRAIAQGVIWDCDVVRFTNLATEALQYGTIGAVQKDRLWEMILGVLYDVEGSEVRSHEDKVSTLEDMVKSSTFLIQQDIQLKTERLIVSSLVV